MILKLFLTVFDDNIWTICTTRGNICAMALLPKQTYTKNEATIWAIPNYWDVLAVVLIFTFIVLAAFGAKQMGAPYRLGDIIPISLNPIHLPAYALRTTMRLFIALFFSLLFTFTF